MSPLWAMLPWAGYWVYLAWEERRAREQPERIRRSMRDLEHRIVINDLRDPETILRRMLLDDLRQMQGKIRAAEYLREHHGLQIDPFAR